MIRRILIASLFAGCWWLCGPRVLAQVPSLLPVTPPQTPVPGPVERPVVPPSAAGERELPDAPSATALESVVVVSQAAFAESGEPLPLLTSRPPVWGTDPDPGFYRRIQQRRAMILSNQRFLNNEVSLPMTSRQKAFIAVTDVSDPGNLAVIGVSSAVYTAANSHSAYGPGMKGFGRNYGYSLAQDSTGEMLGTWLIPSIAHQDPRYHRMPGAPLKRRLVHALAHTVIAQSDDGGAMPNYATLLTYPIAAAAANLYVPGLQRDVPSTARRVVIGLASDPSDALIGEFLPDLARRIHIRVTFFQQVINDISTEHP